MKFSEAYFKGMYKLKENTLTMKEKITYIDSLSMLSPAVHTLCLDMSRLKDFRFCNHKPNLNVFGARRSFIRNLDGIQDIQHIYAYDLSYNKIEDVSLIGENNQILYLNLSNNLITTITSLKDMWLTWLDVSFNNGITGISDIKTLRDITFSYGCDGYDEVKDMVLENINIKFKDHQVIEVYQFMKECNIKRINNIEFSKWMMTVEQKIFEQKIQKLGI